MRYQGAQPKAVSNVTYQILEVLCFLRMHRAFLKGVRPVLVHPQHGC
jgi:hypothetical protein